MSLDCWNPVYDTGCGWRDCLICGPLIELEIERVHRDAREWPKRDIVSEWQAAEREAVNTADDAVTLAELKELRPAAKGARREVEAKARVKRTLTHAQIIEVQGMLAKWPLRALYRRQRGDWESEVWLELLNPTILVARKEGGKGGRRGNPLGLEKRVKAAINRAQAAMVLERKKSNRLVSAEELTE